MFKALCVAGHIFQRCDQKCAGLRLDGLDFASSFPMNAQRPSERLFQRVLENLTTSVVLVDAELRGAIHQSRLRNVVRHQCAQGAHQSVAPFGHGAGRVVRALGCLSARRPPFTERELHLSLFGQREYVVDCTVTALTEPGQQVGLLLELVRIDRQLRISRRREFACPAHRNPGRDSWTGP